MYFYPEDAGTLEMIVGPMFAEKSGELINKCSTMQTYGKKKVIAFKPKIDNRFEEDYIVSRLGNKFKATNLETTITDQIIERLLEQVQDYDIVAFDEVQLYSKKIIELVSKILEQGKHVICAGLNLDYTGREFKYIGGLLALADNIIVKKAYCSICGKPAKFTQRLENGKPSKLGKTVIIGNEEYTPRCSKCFVSPFSL